MRALADLGKPHLWSECGTRSEPDPGASEVACALRFPDDGDRPPPPHVLWWSLAELTGHLRFRVNHLLRSDLRLSYG